MARVKPWLSLSMIDQSSVGMKMCVMTSCLLKVHCEVIQCTAWSSSVVGQTLWFIESEVSLLSWNLHRKMLHFQDSVAIKSGVLLPTGALRPDQAPEPKPQRQPTVEDILYPICKGSLCKYTNGRRYDDCNLLHSLLNSAPLASVWKRIPAGRLCPQSLQRQWQIHCSANVKCILAKATIMRAKLLKTKVKTWH